MAEHPDLAAELDAAEDVVTGRVESVVTEWGVRYDDRDDVRNCGVGGSAFAASLTRSRRSTGHRDALVRRTVTCGPWETTEENEEDGEAEFRRRLATTDIPDSYRRSQPGDGGDG